MMRYFCFSFHGYYSVCYFVFVWTELCNIAWNVRKWKFKKKNAPKIFMFVFMRLQLAAQGFFQALFRVVLIVSFCVADS